MYENIKRQFAEVIRTSQGITNPELDNLFDVWEESKSKFIERFGGLIYEWPEPIEFTMDLYTKQIKICDFVDFIDNFYRNRQLATFIEMNAETFFDNKVSNTCGQDIPKGMKLLKAFKYFESDKDRLRDLQDAASTYIQQKSVKGTLCFSVHPLDFLSSSENTYNWRSCHALDGEYRAGNLSYMCDKTTFMVYLRGADGVHLDAFGNVKWNSKRWRMLIHESEGSDVLFAGRQYPFSSPDGADIVLNIYNNLFNSYRKFGTWSKNYIESYTTEDNLFSMDLNNRYAIIDRVLYPLEKIVRQDPYGMNYNDILCSTCYTKPLYSVRYDCFGKNFDHLLEKPIHIGAPVRCLHCNSDFITDAETMRCNECEISFGYEENEVYGSCSCCGHRIYLDDAHYIGTDDEPVCDECFNKYCFYCYDCGDAYFTDTDGMNVEIEEGEYELVCPHCYRSRRN